MKAISAMKAVLLCSVFFLSTPAHSITEMQQYLNDTKALVKAHKYAEALERTIWFYDHVVEYDPGMSGVRNSFFLRDWLDFAERYEPAMAALQNVRATKNELIDHGDATCATFLDVMSINRVFEEDSKTIEEFRILEAKQPEIAKKCSSGVQSIALHEKAYDLIVRYYPDVDKQFASAKAECIYELNKKPDPNNHLRDSLREAHRNIFIERTLELIAISQIIGDMETAKKLKDEALKVVDDNRLRELIL